MGKGHIHIQLLGTSFTIQADEDPDYLSSLVAAFSEKVREVQRSVAAKDPLRIAILAGILLADDLHKVRGNETPAGLSEEESAEAERIARRLIDSIDETLDDAPSGELPRK